MSLLLWMRSRNGRTRVSNPADSCRHDDAKPTPSSVAIVIPDRLSEKSPHAEPCRGYFHTRLAKISPNRRSDPHVDFSAAGLCHTQAMSLANDEFDRLERLIYRPVSTRPDWLKAWRNEAQYLLYLARRAVDADDEELVQELEEQARDMADVVEARLRHDGLL